MPVVERFATLSSCTGYSWLPREGVDLGDLSTIRSVGVCRHGWLRPPRYPDNVAIVPRYLCLLAEPTVRRVPDLDAVFAANDVMAAAALDVLRAEGRRVPDDVAVAGFDDASIASHTVPPLTTVQQPLARISHEAVWIRLDLIDGQPEARTTMPTRLIVRESA